MKLHGQVAQININPAGGVPKHRVSQANLKTEGVEGDFQRNKKYHGGPERAVCLYCIERIEALQAEGHPISPGSTGENLTLQGIDWDAVKPGVVLQIGDEARLEIASYTLPCFKIKASFAQEEFKRAMQKLHPGWSRVYARVLQEGLVREGDQVVFSRP